MSKKQRSLHNFLLSLNLTQLFFVPEFHYNKIKDCILCCLSCPSLTHSLLKISIHWVLRNYLLVFISQNTLPFLKLLLIKQL